MPPQPMSPRLPGVSILYAEATGPQYRRWRKGVESAFTAKGTWGHCDGSCPMPMPEQTTNNLPPTWTSEFTKSEPQPSLLEERRAWVKKDRDVKLDIFLSISDEIKMDVFEVGPPLPPASMTAKDMITALDEQFEDFKFEDFHHVFCHFLNLHIDQYASLEEFNLEFMATLEDMADHGFPLDNLQATSAYFSKLRCTQNPWVAKKLKEWDTLPSTPRLADLIKEVPPWIIIRPLAYKNQSHSAPESYSEDLADSHHSGEDDLDDVATLSSASSREQEITVHASVDDLTEAFPLPSTKLHPLPIPKRLSSKSSRSSMKLPAQLQLPAQQPAPLNRPLPPLPSDASSTRSQSPKPSLDSLLKVPPSPGLRPQTPKSPGPRPASPALRPASPGLRPASPAIRPLSPTPRPNSPALQPRSTAQPPSTLEVIRRSPLVPQGSVETFTTWPPHASPLLRQGSNNSSAMSLPIQGVPELSSSPPDNSPIKENKDDDRSPRKRSWSIKARLSGRRYDVKEIIY